MKCDYFQDEKLEYENIEIPDELLLMVRQTVAADRRKKAAGVRMRILKTAGSVAAVCFLCLTIGVNSSYAFAETAVKIPIVKNVAKAVVMRSYREEIIAVYEENKTGSQRKNTLENSPEEQFAGIVPTESGNDVPRQEEMPKQEHTEQEPEEVVPEGFDAWKAEMTPEKFKEVTEVYSPDMEMQYADAPEKLRTILLAQLQDKDISLYGYHEDGKLTGAALRVGNTHQYFDWNYMNESGKLPDLDCVDIDGDGEEEIIVSLYNGELQKRDFLREISKEDIAAPEEEAGEKADTEESTEEIVSGDSAEEKDEPEQSTVSGNEVTVPAESEKEEFEQPVGELWAVSIKGETWSAAVLSADDCESQILHQLKAAYDAQTGRIQLYLVEEPFLDAVKGPDQLEFEAVNLAPTGKFTVKKGLFLQFQMEVSLLKEDGEKVYVLLEPELETEISLEGGSLVTGEIKEK